jgi:predicted Zn finger-like uncharacterized protein
VYTRCPGCHTVHPVNAALLVVDAGRYRCGKCNKVSSALESLFDEWPQAGAKPPQPGEMPVLGLSLDLERAAQSRQAPTGAGLGDSDAEGAAATGGGWRWLARTAWIAGAIVVLAVATWQWAEFQGKPLLERPEVESTLVRLGLRQPPPAKPFRDLERIHLVNRELTSHPYLPGHLRLSATIVNRAARIQPYPAIEVTLLNATGEVVLRQRFAPSDFLDPESAPGAGMVPQAYLPLVLDLVDPGVQAVGFELEFR